MSRPPKSFYSLQVVGRMLKIPKSTYDGAYKNGIESVGAIKPIAHLFKKFEDGDTFSYAILKSHFDKWQKTGKAPKVSTGRPKKYIDKELFPYINYPIPIALYDSFREIVDNANAMSIVQTCYRDQISVAIDEYIQRRPQLLTKNLI